MSECIRKPNTECFLCKKPVYKRPSQMRGRVFCGSECYSKVRPQAKEVDCPVCGKNFKFRNSAKTITCSIACANKIRRKKRTTESMKWWGLKDRLLEQRGAECEECGYNKYVEVLDLHHLVERRHGGTDDPGNLKILCCNCHAVEHRVIRARKNKKFFVQKAA